MNQKPLSLKRITLSPPTHTNQVRFRLYFRGSSPPPSVEFETTGAGAMTLMKALQAFQVKHKIPIPSGLRSKGLDREIEAALAASPEKGG